jgi:hypothetical protein
MSRTRNPTAPFFSVSLNSTFTTLSGTASDVRDLFFDVGAFERWRYEFNLFVACNSTGGVRPALVVPAGSTFKAFASGPGASTDSNRDRSLTVSGTLTSGTAHNLFNNSATLDGRLDIRGYIDTAGTPGRVQLQFAAGTGLQTAYIAIGSAVKAWREFRFKRQRERRT